jgi:snurportin-1
MYAIVYWKNLSTNHILIAPNTTLRSRVLGKMLLPRFPSSLPPLTVLDCILDVNWRDNGIIHVLDVLKWKGQDVGDCETPFRWACIACE